jgi:hypothetical protein
MADNYKVKVHIEIVECADAATDAPSKEGVGAFEHVISVEQAHSIDACEQALLQTNYAALRDAFARYLSRASRQYALEVAGSLAECEVKPYRVEGEVGRITFETYGAEQMEETADDTVKSMFPTLHAKEWYRTTGFKELALVHGTVEGSYRKTSDLINRVRHQEDAIPRRAPCGTTPSMKGSRSWRTWNSRLRRFSRSMVLRRMVPQWRLPLAIVSKNW